MERFFGALEHEHLYGEEIADGPMVAAAADHYRHPYNDVRPHETIGFRTPLSAWRDSDASPTPNLLTPESVSPS